MKYQLGYLSLNEDVFQIPSELQNLRDCGLAVSLLL